MPKRVARTAVKRNYARRRIREFFRLNKEMFPENTDCLFRLYSYPVNWETFFKNLVSMVLKAKNTIGRPRFTR